MVRLTTVRSTFHACVIAARLGSEGILATLRGNVDGPYPMGDVHVFVDEDSLAPARELLLADEVESAFDEGVGDEGVVDNVVDDDGRTPPALWIVLAAIVLVAALSLTRAI